MEILPDDGDGTPRGWRAATFAHALWYGSRTLFVATVVIIGFLIKEPLDNYVARLTVTDSGKIRLSQSLERVREIQLMYERAQLANERFQDLLHLAAHQTTQALELQLRDFQRQKENTDAALMELREFMLRRSHPMDEQVRRVVFTLIEDIDLGVTEAESVFQGRVNHPNRPHKTLRATAVRAQQLLRQMENLVFLESQNLNGRKD